MRAYSCWKPTLRLTLSVPHAALQTRGMFRPGGRPGRERSGRERPGRERVLRREESPGGADTSSSSTLLHSKSSASVPGADTRRHTQTHADTRRHTQTHTDTQTRTQTRTQTDTHTNTHRGRQTPHLVRIDPNNLSVTLKSMSQRASQLPNGSTIEIQPTPTQKTSNDLYDGTVTYSHLESEMKNCNLKGSCAYGLVEGFGLVAQVFRLLHQIIQLLPSLQQRLHSIVLKRERHRERQRERRERET